MSKVRNNAAVSTNMGSMGNENQDNFYLNGEYCEQEKESHVSYSVDFKDNGVFAVADGLDDQNFGNFASFKAMELLHNTVSEKKEDIDEEIDSYVKNINGILCKKSSETGLKTGAAFVLLSLKKNKARIYNVGDSRCYLFRDGELKKLSKDHTLASELAEMNALTAEEAESNSGKNVLTQHLGLSQDEILISAYKSEPVETKKGDKFFLCSAAVSKVLNDEELAKLLLEDASCKRLANNIVFSAMDKNSGENLTAMVVKIDDVKKDRDLNNLLFGAALAGAAVAGVITGMIINNFTV